MSAAAGTVLAFLVAVGFVVVGQMLEGPCVSLAVYVLSWQLQVNGAPTDT